MRIGRIFAFVFIAIMLTGIVSALEFDNVKSYDSATETIEIRNSVLGIEWLSLDKVATLKLLTPRHNMIWGTGYQRVAEIEIINEGEYENAFADMTFYDKTFGFTELNGKEFDYKYKTRVNVTNPILGCPKIDQKPGELCELEKIGEQTEEVDEWVTLDITKPLPKGKITIGIYYHDVQPGITIEWIPNYFGLRLDEWADFEGAVQVEKYDTGQDTYYLATTTRRGGQTFTIGQTTPNYLTIVGFSMFLTRTGLPGTARIGLFATDGTVPVGDALQWNSSVNADLINDPTYAWFNITGFDYDTTNGTKYAIVINTTAANSIEFGVDSTDGYSGGDCVDANPAWVKCGASSLESYFIVWATTDYPIGNITTTLNSPSDNFNASSNSIIFNASSNVINSMNLTNATLFVWNSTSSEIFRNTTVLSGNLTINTTWNQVFTYDDSYKWNVLSCGFNATNAVICRFADSNRTINIDTSAPYFVLNTSNNVYTNSLDNILVNITTYDLQLQTCQYNSTSNTTLTTYTCNTNFYINSSSENFDIGTCANDTAGNLNCTNWDMTYYYIPTFALCNATYTIPYLNVTFKNETVGAESVTSALVSTFYYWLYDRAVNYTLSYTNTTENSAYQFCAAPAFKTVNATASLQYYNAESPQRSYSITNLSLTNSTYNMTLYLLPTSAGIYVTFQVQTSGGSKISGATVSITRSGFGYIETKLTDDAGIATFFLDPLYAYTITASKTGYSDVTTTITPTQTSYTIIMGEDASLSPASDYSKGVKWSILPASYQLLNNTQYPFNFTINSTFWTLDKFGINITDINGNQVGYNEDVTPTGGTVNVNVNTGTNDTLYLQAFWVANSTYVYVGDKAYYILNTDGTEFSIWNFLTDFDNYVSNENDTDGLFGLKKESEFNFSLALIMFLIIFVTAGVLSYNFGIQSPLFILLIITGMTMFFEVVFPLIDITPHSSTPGASIVLLFISVIVGLWEARS